jgi:hypothetical protein
MISGGDESMKRSILMMTVLVLATLACISSPFNAVRGSGNVVVETYDVSGFDRVELETIGTLYIEQGAVDSLTIETDDNILPLLIAHSGNGLLSLSDQAGSQLLPTAGIIFRVTVRDLRLVAANSSGNIFVGPIEADRLEVQLNGSGRVEMDSVAADQFSIASKGSGDMRVDQVVADSIETKMYASGNVELAGETGPHEVDIRGSGSLHAGDLQSSETVVAIRASGSATVHAADELDVSISGSGDVSYYGDPALTQSITASGNLRSLGAK